MKTQRIIGLFLVLVLCLNSPPTFAQPLQNNSSNALEKLRAHSEEFNREVIEVLPQVYVAVGYGLGNSTLIVGEDGVLIVDTLEGTEAAQQVLTEFQKITTKPVKAIIYTHSHADHIGGAKVFAGDDSPEIYARANFRTAISAEQEKLEQILQVRNSRQLGFTLSPEERINLGIGGSDRPLGGFGEGFLPPNHRFTEERLSLEIAGINLELVAAPGETEDQLYVWLPDLKVLLCGDNYYKAFPNLYALRGSSRDPAQWADSLDLMLQEKPEYLIPGHTRPLKGSERIQRVLTDYRNAMGSILAQTLTGMNQGLTPDQLVELVELPPELKGKPYLQEFYGAIPWTVRAIYGDHLGWFDGNPTHLFPLSLGEKAQRLARLLGGKEGLFKAAQKALADQDFQWVLHLSDYLLALQFHPQEAKQLKAEALIALAQEQINANARNYYLSVAQELHSRE